MNAEEPDRLFSLPVGKRQLIQHADGNTRVASTKAKHSPFVISPESSATAARNQTGRKSTGEYRIDL
jgi:hypothetical protein